MTSLPQTTPFPAVEAGSHADLEEIAFWLGLEDALRSVRNELARPEVLLTIAFLKSAKRFVATTAFENNTGLDAAESVVSDVAGFLRDYPAPALAAAGDWTRISSGVSDALAYVPRVRQSRHYDLDRLARLVEATTETLRDRVESALRDAAGGTGGIVLGLPYGRYESEVRGPSVDVFVLFDDRYGTFSEFFLEQGRVRGRAGGATATPAAVLAGITLHHAPLRGRLDAVHRFRSQHERLRGVVEEVLSSDGGGGADGDDDGSWATREVDEAPRSCFGGVDVLDLTPGGDAAFAAALEGYDRRVDAIEERLARLLRDKLSSCKVIYRIFVKACSVLCVVLVLTFYILLRPRQDAEDMFRVFARFSPLLSRTRVRAAVKEFQLQLMETVGEAVSGLQAKFAHRYESSCAADLASARGVPPVAGKVLWARQMERQVHALMGRMGDVLGKVRPVFGR